MGGVRKVGWHVGAAVNVVVEVDVSESVVVCMFVLL